MNLVQVVQVLEHLFKRIWDEKEIPEEWKCALIHPLHNRVTGRMLTTLEGFSLLPVAYEILQLQIIEPILRNEIGEYQAVFRKSRACVEPIFNLKSLIRYRITRG